MCARSKALAPARGTHLSNPLCFSGHRILNPPVLLVVMRGSRSLHFGEKRHQRSLPIMRLPSRSLASHTRHLVASGLVKLTGFGLSRWASICSLTKAPKSGVEGGLQVADLLEEKGPLATLPRGVTLEASFLRLFPRRIPALR